jgi:hypothetical protein
VMHVGCRERVRDTPTCWIAARLRIAVTKEDRDRCLVRAGQQAQRRFESELVSDLESDWPAVQVDPVDGGGARFVGARLRYRAVGGSAGPFDGQGGAGERFIRRCRGGGDLAGYAGDECACGGVGLQQALGRRSRFLGVMSRFSWPRA